MAQPLQFFDSLAHITPDGTWLGTNRHDARQARLMQELSRCAPARACLVAIAGFIENKTVLRAAREHPDQLVPIGSFNPVACADDAEIRGQVTRLVAEGFSGLKLHPRLNGYDPLDPKVGLAIRAAGERGLIVFLDTLFRQADWGTRWAPDVVDALAAQCPSTSIIALHGGGSALLPMSEVVAAHANLVLDLSFTLFRYAGSSIDDDLRFLLRTFDRRMIVGSDFPEYLPCDTCARIEELSVGLDPVKRENVLSANLAKLIATAQAAKQGRASS